MVKEQVLDILIDKESDTGGGDDSGQGRRESFIESSQTFLPKNTKKREKKENCVIRLKMILRDDYVSRKRLQF